MLSRSLDARTLSEVQTLIEGNFAGRDELHAAARSLEDRGHSHVCRQLAKQLADNAIELQQLAAANGAKPAEPLDLDEQMAALFDLAKANRGEAGVLRVAADGERELTANYDQAVEAAESDDAKALLSKHREKVQFSEEVLRNLGSREKQLPDLRLEAHVPLASSGRPNPRGEFVFPVFHR